MLFFFGILLLNFSFITFAFVFYGTIIEITTYLKTGKGGEYLSLIFLSWLGFIMLVISTLMFATHYKLIH
jgi:hypothetical protein